jgi:hypothetical protein
VTNGDASSAPPAAGPAAGVPLERAAPPAAPTAATRPVAATPAQRRASSRRVLLGCALVAFVLHSLALLWNWWVWSAEPGARGWWMVITDLPVSLLYLHHTDGRLFWWSFLLGGVQWAGTGALVAWAAWRIAGWRRRRGV